MLAAYLEDGGKIPRSEGQLERGASEQRCPTVVQQCCYLRLHGTEDDQTSRRVAVLKTIHLLLKQGREPPQRPTVADLELVEDYDRAA